MKPFKWFIEDAPTNATGSAVAGTGDDSSTVVVKKKVKVYRRKKRKIDMEAKQVDEARRKDEAEKWVEEERNYRKEYDNYHSQPEQRERNAARLRARRQMEKWGKVKKFDKKDVHHKDNNPLNNEEDNLAVTTQNWNRSEPRLRKEESINIEERELTSNELKRREEIAKELSDADFKKRYGKDWKSIKIATATNMAKKEETIMGKKYLETKPGSLEEEVDRVYDIWRQPQDSIVDEGFSSSLIKKAVKIATQMGGNMTGAVKKIEKIKKGLSNDSAVMDALKMANEQAEEKTKVDGRTKAYKEALRRIKMRQERNKHFKKEEVEELEEKLKKGFFRTPNGDDVWVENNPSVLPKAWAKKVEAGKIDPTKMDFSGPPNKWKEIKASYDPELEEEVNPTILKVIDMSDEDFDALIENFDEQKLELLDGLLKKIAGRLTKSGRAKAAGKKADKIQKKRDKKAGKIKKKRQGASDLKKAKERLGKLKQKNSYTPSGEKIEEAESGDKEAYEKYVKKMLKKFGVDSPADLKGDDKKKFFAALDKGWESDAEKSGKSEDHKKKNKNVEDEDENPVGKSYNEAAIDDLRKIVKTKSMGKVSGTKVDLFSASAMVQVYDALNDKNKAKVEKMLKDKRGVMTFADFAMSQAKK